MGIILVGREVDEASITRRVDQDIPDPLKISVASLVFGVALVASALPANAQSTCDINNTSNPGANAIATLPYDFACGPFAVATSTTGGLPAMAFGGYSVAIGDIRRQLLQ